MWGILRIILQSPESWLDISKIFHVGIVYGHNRSYETSMFRFRSIIHPCIIVAGYWGNIYELSQSAFKCSLRIILKIPHKPYGCLWHNIVLKYNYVDTVKSQKRGCEKTRLSFFASPFLYLLCINDWNHAQRKRTSPTP